MRTTVKLSQIDGTIWDDIRDFQSQYFDEGSYVKFKSEGSNEADQLIVFLQGYLLNSTVPTTGRIYIGKINAVAPVHPIIIPMSVEDVDTLSSQDIYIDISGKIFIRNLS